MMLWQRVEDGNGGKTGGLTKGNFVSWLANRLLLLENDFLKHSKLIDKQLCEKCRAMDYPLFQSSSAVGKVSE